MKALLFAASILFALISHAQTDQVKQWEDIVQSNANDSIKFMACIDLHNAYFVSDRKKSKVYTDKMLELATKLHQRKFLVKAYQGLARWEMRDRNYDKIIPYDLKVLEYEIAGGNPALILAANLALARDYLDAEMPAKALPYITTSDKLSDEMNDASQKAKVEQTYGWYYKKINQHKKAASYFNSAILSYAKINDEKMIAASKIALAETLFQLGETDSVPVLLFGALDYYKKNSILSRQAFCYGLLGQCYLTNGFEKKGIENYLEAKRLYRLANSYVEEALATIDLARLLLSKKNYKEFEKYAGEANKSLEEYKYEYGMIMMKTLQGHYYSEKENYQLAEKYFSEADKMAVANALPDLKTDNERYWAEHRRRQKNFKGADSLLFSYAKKISESKEPEIIAKELATMIRKNPSIDSNTIKVLSLLYAPGGVEKLRKQLGDKSLSESGMLSNTSELNPFSLASGSYDSLMSITYNGQLLQMETQFRTRQIADSLRIANQNAIIYRENLKNRNTVLLASALVVLLLATGLWLQYRSRKRAENDKARIELLQNEIHHRVKNNLGVISRLVEVAGKNAVDVVPLSSLKNRIKSIESLHNHLYSGEVKTGNISLQSYFEDLCMAVAATYETAKNIKIDINASAEIDSHIAEKLGLIINELVTNCYKYAFDGMESGYIHISAQAKSKKGLEIIVEDNGVGFEAEKIQTSYGMKLIRGLSNELNGRFAFINKGGTRFTLEIPS